MLWAWGCSLALLAAGTAASAATVQVTTIADSGAGSLRSAIVTAGSGDTITFAAALAGATITLTSGEIAITKSLAIQGLGANQLTISGNNSSRIFDVSDGAVTLAISGLTLENGNATAGRGGAIASLGNLVVDDVQFQFNQAADGGGALAVAKTAAGDVGRALVRGSTFANNAVAGSSGAGGGAIIVAGNAALASGGHHHDHDTRVQ